MKWDKNINKHSTENNRFSNKNPLNPGVTHLIPIGKTPVNPLLSVYGGMESAECWCTRITFLSYLSVVFQLSGSYAGLA